jgi:hypothetical protein
VRLYEVRVRALSDGAAMTRPRKWAFLRIPRQTHRLLLAAKARAGISMSELVKRIVQFIYSEEPMQALSFFVLYLNNQATFIIASKDAETAELGFRQQMLGQSPKPTLVKAVPIMEAKQEDVLRVGIAAIITQQTQTNAMLQAVLNAGGKRH